MLNWIVLNRTDYLHKMDLALNNLQRLICHKTQQNNKTNQLGCLPCKVLYIILKMDKRETHTNKPKKKTLDTGVQRLTLEG